MHKENLAFEEFSWQKADQRLKSVRDLKLRTVVIVGLVLGLVIPAFFGAWYSVKAQRSKLEKELQTDVRALSRILLLGLQEPIWGINPEAARPLLEALNEDPRILAILVFDAEGSPFIHITKEQIATPKESAIGARELHNADATSENAISSTLEIMREGKRIGRARLLLSRHKMQEKLAQEVQETLLTLLAQLTASIALIVVLLKVRVLNPLERLVGQASRLSHKQLESPFVWTQGDEMSKLGQSLEEARVSLRSLFAEVDAKNLELVNVNHGLEELVAERTAALSNILNNVKSGFFIVDRQLHVAPGFTKSCLQLFGERFVTGMPLTQALQLKDKEAFHYAFFVGQVFEDELPEQVAIEQLPTRFTVSDRVLILEATAIRSTSGDVSALLFTVNDGTKLQQFEEETQSCKVLLGILQRTEAFRTFVSDTRLQLGKARHFLQAGQNGYEVRYLLHTIKGTAAVFGLERISHLIHQFEDLETLQLSHLEVIENELRAFLRRHAHLIKVTFDGSNEEVFELTQSRLQELEAIGSLLPARDAAALRLREWAHKSRLKPISVLLGPLEEACTQLAMRLQKSVSIQISGQELRVDSARFAPVLGCLSHLCRNAIDHGIETPSERTHKSEAPCLKIEFSESPLAWSVRVSDNGRGINTEGLVRKAMERGVLTAAQAEQMNYADKCRLIFWESLSTAAEVTELSGRGLGVSSVAQTLADMGGEIHVQSTPGYGTHFEMRIPKSTPRPGQEPVSPPAPGGGGGGSGNESGAPDATDSSKPRSAA